MPNATTLQLCPRDEAYTAGSPDVASEETEIRQLIQHELYRQLHETLAESESHTPDEETMAARVVRSLLENCITSGKPQGLKFLTDLCGIGESAELRRESARMAREKFDREASAGDGSGDAIQPDMEQFQQIWKEIGYAMTTEVQPRSIADFLEPEEERRGEGE